LDRGFSAVLDIVTSMGRWAPFGLVVVALAGGCGAHGSATGPLRLAAHWGTPAPDITFVGEKPDAKGRARVALGSRIQNVAVAPGGRFALLHVDAEPWINGLLVLALPEGRIVRALPAPRVSIDARGFALAPDGRSALFASGDRDVIIWDTEHAREIGRLGGPHTASVEAVAIAPDGRAAITGDTDGVVAIWNLPDRTLRHKLSVQNGTKAVAFSPDGRRAGAAGFPATIWDTATGKEIVALIDGQPRGDRIAFTLDSNRLVMTSAYAEIMTVSDLRTGKLLQERRKRPIPKEIAMAPDGRSLLGQDYFAIHRWRLDDLTAVEELGDYGASPSGIGVAVGGRVFFTTAEEGGWIRLWDTATGKRLVPPQARAVTALAWTPDGTKLLEGASDGTFSVWTSLGNRLSESTHHADVIRSIVVSADGKLAASVASDAALWSFPFDRPRAIGTQIRFPFRWAAIASDGQRVVLGNQIGESMSAAVASPGQLSSRSCQGGWTGGRSIALDDGRSVLAAETSWGRYPADADLEYTDDRGPTLQRWSIETCKALWSAVGPARTAMALSPSSQTALVADRKGGLELYRMSDGVSLRRFERPPAPPGARQGDGDDDENGPYTTSIAFLDESRAMTGDGSGLITIWDVMTGAAVAELTDARTRGSYPTAIAVRPGSRTVAVGTGSGEILIFAR
jgi:WD40 repeat protein